MNLELFTDDTDPKIIALSDSTVLLRGFVTAQASSILQYIHELAARSPFRTMVTPTGKMSVMTSSWGPYGWVSDKQGYRYALIDPVSGLAWPTLPAYLYDLAAKAASHAGYENFTPNTCLVNRYEAGAKMGLHQDKNERDTTQPIVSFSLGGKATFLWGGLVRTDAVHKLELRHGDVLVWGKRDRLRFHGIAPVLPQQHALTGPYRINLTFRYVA